MRVSKHAQGRRARFRSARVALRCGHTTINKSRQQRGRRQHKFPPNRWHVRASSPFPRSFPTTATTCRRPSPHSRARRAPAAFVIARCSAHKTRPGAGVTDILIFMTNPVLVVIVLHEIHSTRILKRHLPLTTFYGD